MIDFAYYLMSAVAALIALTIHEYSHALAAYKLGDGTARSFGRLSLNPLKHLDLFGTLCMIFCHVGWAKPVPINARNFRNPKRGFAISALAGPLSNITVAIFTALIYLLTWQLVLNTPFSSPDDWWLNLLLTTIDFLYIFFSVNIGLGVFNLLPVPPFDGSRIVYTFLPPKLYFGIMRYERYIYFGVLGWLLLGNGVKDALLSISFIAANPVLSFIAGIFSLSDILGVAISYIGGLIFKMWQLIPALNIGI